MTPCHVCSVGASQKQTFRKRDHRQQPFMLGEVLEIFIMDLRATLLTKYRLYRPVFEAFKALDKTADISEIYNKVAEILNLSQEQRSIRCKNKNQSEFCYRVGRVLSCLQHPEIGIAERVGPNQWTLTQLGRDLQSIEPKKIHNRNSNQSTNMSLIAEEVENPQRYIEGAIKQLAVNAYERNPKAREQCVKYYGVTCYICGFNFEERFGAKGKGLIHVHHLRPLAGIRAEYEVNPVEDLRPVCPNCHALIHSRRPAYKIEEVKLLIEKASKQE